MSKKNKWPYLFCLPFIAAYLTFSLYPMLYSLQLSFFDWNGIGNKTFVGLQNYITLFTKDPLFWKALKNTVILMAFSTPITVFLGLVVAYLLFDISRGKRLYQTVNFFPYITTPVAIGFIFSYLFDWQSGYVNKLLTSIGILDEPFYWLNSEIASKVIIVIMIVWRYLGYYMTIYLAAMTSMPMEVYEAAAVDGASNLKIFTRITIPMLRHTTVFLVITSMIGGLQMFDVPQILTNGKGDPMRSSMTLIMYLNNHLYSKNYGMSGALSVMLFIITGILSLIVFKFSNGKQDK